jgi:uncharacterized membrane protein YkoI
MKISNRIRTILTAISLGGLTSSTLLAGEETEAQLQADAKVTGTRAEQTTLAKVLHGPIKSSELEKERDKLVWSFDIAMPNSRNITEVQVDAKTGKIAAVEIETPHDQAREATEDKPKGSLGVTS